jgi:stage V sporulation protein G
MKISAKINRIVDNPEYATKAYASVTLDGMFAVHGIRVMDGENGLFVNMPSTSFQDNDGNTKYRDTFHAITKPAREAISKAVLNSYNYAIEQSQVTEIEVEQTEGEEEDIEEDLSENYEPVMT